MSKSEENAAPLLATIDIKAPDKGRASFVSVAHGQMRLAIWRSRASKKRGSVLFVHGLGECIEKHYPTISELLERGFHAVAIDLAGHGLSSDPPPERVRDFSAYDESVDAALDQLRSRRLARPWLGLGHSMGAALLLTAAARRPDTLAGIFLSAPMLGICAFETLSFMLPLTEMLATPAQSPFLHFPKFVPHNYTADLQTRTHCRALLMEHPQLAPRVAAVPWCAGAVGYLEKISDPQLLEKISLPVAIALAQEDVLVSNDKARTIAAALPNCSVFEVEGAQHELLLEQQPLRCQVWQHIDAFLAAPANGRS